MYVTTLQLNCASEYTLAFMDSGTYSVAAVPALQGAKAADPNAEAAIEVTDAGMVTESNPMHDRNANAAMAVKVMLI